MGLIGLTQMLCASPQKLYVLSALTHRWPKVTWRCLIFNCNHSLEEGEPEKFGEPGEPMSPQRLALQTYRFKTWALCLQKARSLLHFIPPALGESLKVLSGLDILSSFHWSSCYNIFNFLPSWFMSSKYSTWISLWSTKRKHPFPAE